MSVHAEPPPAIVPEPHGIKYATGNQLGKGGFAICHKAEMLDKDVPTGRTVALKIVKTRMEPAKLAQKFVTELQIHSKLAHPNIVGFHRAFSFEANTYVVLELCSSGSLADLLRRRKNLTMPEIRRFIIQVSGAIKYLHIRNIVHRDLKTGNLFLDGNMNIKVGDFGLAALLVSSKDMDAKRRTTMCGTPNYLAPEILEKGKGHNEKVDLWAIGIIAYTLAVGKAPFHASSKEEIYKKLKAGDYSWPDLSSHTNEISADLRDLVATLLVDEELRPSPDKIVLHPFFKIAFVPTVMSRTQLQKAPVWNVPLPSPEVLQRGYSDSWYTVCKDSGVGEYSPGKCFLLNAGKKIRSIVKDIEKEVAAGRQPVLPIPEDTVYSWTSNPLGGLCEIAEEKESSSEGQQLQEVSHNERLIVPKIREMPVEAAVKDKKDAGLMPPPSWSNRRQAPLRGTARRPRTDSQDRLENAENIPEIQELQEDSRPRSSSGKLPSTIRATARTNRTAAREEKVEEEPANEIVPPRRAVDASLARRPRTVRKRVAEPETVPSPEEEEPQTTGDARVRSTAVPRVSRTRAKQAEPEVIEIHEDEMVGQQQALVLPPAPAMAATLPVPATKRRQGGSSAMHGSDPSSVLERLSTFRDNVASALQNKHQAPSRSAPKAPVKPLPFVKAWVDYSRKYGVGYVLEDGTVGCIINAFATKKAPAVHVLVRQGDRWIRRVGKKFENLETLPFHIFEDRGAAGIVPVKTVEDKQDERQRVLKILWVKFARYMQKDGVTNEEVDARQDDTSAEDLLFVRFYQRMGNVGIWGFSDGCLQLHFPDHTKFVFSADGLHVSATLVTVEGVQVIAHSKDLPMKMLREREILAYPVSTLLYGSRSTASYVTFGDIVNANMFQEKLQFLLRVLSQWLEGGGLGCGGGDEVPLQWDGLWVNEHARKIDWVTVGRYGGDEMRV